MCRFLESAKGQLDSLVSALDEDTFTGNISDVEVDTVEQQTIRAGSQPGGKGDLLPALLVHALVRRTLRGLPLTGRVVGQLQTLGQPCLQLLEEQVAKVRSQGSARDKRLLRAMLQKLIFFGVLGPDSSIVKDAPTEFCLRSLEPPAPSLKAEVPLCETFNLKKICRYNAAVQLLGSFKAPQLTGLARSLRPAVQVSQRWSVEEHYHRALGKATSLPNLDDVSVILAKVKRGIDSTVYTPHSFIFNSVTGGVGSYKIGG